MTLKQKYTYRPNLFQKQRTIVSGHDGLEIRNKSGEVTRRIEWDNVSRIVQYQSGSARTEDGEKVPLLAFTVIPHHGRRITFVSGSYDGPGSQNVVFADQHESFLPLILDIKRRLHRLSPDIPLVTGSRGYSIMFGLLGAVIGALVVFMGGALIAGEIDLSKAWLLVAQTAVFVCAVGPVTCWAARAWWPVHTTLRADLASEET